MVAKGAGWATAGRGSTQYRPLGGSSEASSADGGARFIWSKEDVAAVPVTAMLPLMLVLCAVAATTTTTVVVAAAGPQPGLGRAITRESNVVWHAPTWADDGTGSMPIGNGDVTAMVWVDSATGDLRLVLGKSDAFDENSMKVKTGVLRLAFDPPLWVAPPTPPLPPPSVSLCPRHGAPRLPVFRQVNATAVSTIGDRHHMLKAFPGKHVSPEVAASLCCNTTGCVAFSFDASWGLELFSSTQTDVQGVPAGGHWKTWVNIYANHSRPPASSAPPPPSWGDSACVPGEAFCQTLDLATATVTITTPVLTANISVDLNPPLSGDRAGDAAAPNQQGGVLRVAVRGQTPHSRLRRLTVTLEPYRTRVVPTAFAGPFYQRNCYPRQTQKDTIVEADDSSITWFHWNVHNTSFFNDTVRAQGIDPAAAASSTAKGAMPLKDPFTRRIFGGRVTGTELKTVAGSGGLQLATNTTTNGELEVQVKLLTLPDATPRRWLAAIDNLQRSSATSTGRSPVDCQRGQGVEWGQHARCSTTWDEITDRSYVQVVERRSAGEGSHPTRTAARNISTHAAWDRYLSIIQGRSSYAPIKFNGQDFLSDQAGHGWDYREWGEAYWWQGTRHPYCESQFFPSRLPCSVSHYRRPIAR